MRFYKPIHEAEQTADGDGGMQGSLVPARGEHCVGVGLRHARRRQRQLSHESENRSKLAVDGSGREVVDQTVDRLWRHAEQFRGRAVPTVAILAGIEGRDIGANQLSLSGCERGRVTQDRLGNTDPMRVDFRVGGKNVLGRRIFGH